MTPELQRRIARAARLINRSERFLRLSFLSNEEAALLLREHEAEEEAERVATPPKKSKKSKVAAPFSPPVENDHDGELDDDDMLADTLRTDEEGGTLPLSQDDGSYPVGPRAEKNKSRYQISPGHGQGLSDLLRSTASVRALRGIAKLLND